MKINITSFPGAAVILLATWLLYDEENIETNDNNGDYLCISLVHLLLFLRTAMWLMVFNLRWLMQMGIQLPKGQGYLLLSLRLVPTLNNYEGRMKPSLV